MTAKRRIMILRLMGIIVKSPYLVSERKLLIFPISASGLKFNPQNTPCIPAVKICAFLELDSRGDPCGRPNRIRAITRIAPTKKTI